MNKIKKTFKALRRWLFRTPAGFMLIGLTFWLFLFSLFAYSQGLYTWAVGEVKAAEINKGKVNVTLGIMSEEVVSKDEEIKTLEERFQELMDNPITFKQTYFLEKQLFPATDKYEIPRALVAGQWAIESARAVNKPGHNYYGLMQWDKEGKRSLQNCPSLDHCVRNYANTIKSILKRKGYTYDPKEDPVEILRKLQERTPRYEGDSEHPEHYIELVSQTKEFKAYEDNKGKD